MARRTRRPPPQPITDPADWRRHLIVVGVVQHPTAGHYQIWLHARGQTAMLLAFRTSEQADAAKQALGDALLRGDFATLARWLAAVAAIGASSDAPLEPVPDTVFAAIRASIQQANLALPPAARPKAPDATRA